MASYVQEAMAASVLCQLSREHIAVLLRLKSDYAFLESPPPLAFSLP